MMRFWSISSLMLITVTSWADESVWRDLGLVTNTQAVATSQARLSSSPAINTSVLNQYRHLALDEDSLRTALNQASANHAGLQAKTATPVISLPLPDGEFANITVTPRNVLAPELANQYPDIQTWRISSTDGSTLNGVMDFSPLGFHAMLIRPDGDTIFIDPVENNGQREYTSFSKRQNKSAFRSEWQCTTHKDNSFRPDISSNTALRTALKSDATIHKYRIAIAATKEYTNSHGGTPTTALAAINTTISRINEIYQRDLAIELELVSGTNLIYTSINPGPYNETSGNAISLLTLNQENIDKVIGSANYDIGHLFGRNLGTGLAYVGVVCNAENKAKGLTAVNLDGDSFAIDYAAHEIGHQLNAEHTFNSTQGSCSSGRIAGNAYEPGSGSTIMGYAGICGSDNLQNHSDDMFHAKSIQTIRTFVNSGSGSACGTLNASATPANSNPTADAKNDYTIPAKTPFILTGSGMDTDLDTLTYSWEQIDTGTASPVNVDTGDNALIRAQKPTTSSYERTIPDMASLVSGSTVPGEVLPSTSRSLNFRLSVRDGKGGYGYDDMKVNVLDTGSAFSVTQPADKSLIPGSNQTILWNVAGTDQPPINCSAVDIAISTDNGATFKELAANRPNSGSATVVLPSTLGNNNYLRVACRNNIFFALSASSPATANVASSSTSEGNTGGGGGGSFPLSWLLPAGLYLVLRRRKGTRS